MVIKLNNKDVELFFGIAFIAELDRKFKATSSGMQFGFGVNTALVYLEQRNPVILVDLIQAATITERAKPKEEHIVEYVESQDIEELCSDFLKELRTASTTKAMVQKLEKEAKLRQ